MGVTFSMEKKKEKNRKDRETKGRRGNEKFRRNVSAPLRELIIRRYREIGSTHRDSNMNKIYAQSAFINGVRELRFFFYLERNFILRWGKKFR